MSITWNNANLGTLELTFNDGRKFVTVVYTLEYAIRKSIEEYIRIILNNIDNYNNNINIEYNNYDFHPLTIVNPSLSQSQIDSIITLINNNIISLTKNYCQNKTENDFYYLINLGKDFNSNCIYCKTKKIDKPCILKPCGDSICLESCFNEMAHRKRFHKHLTYIITTYNNVEFIHKNKINTNSYLGYNCYKCNTIVEKTIRLAHVEIPTDLLNYLTNIILNLYNT